MNKVFRNPLFLASIPLLACGIAFGVLGASGQATFGYMAPGFLVPGLLLMAWGARASRTR